jgi:hypothetical protein
MTVPYRTFLTLGLVSGLLGIGYVFAPQPGAAVLPASPKAAPVASSTTPAAPAARSPGMLVTTRAPVPMATPIHRTYFVPKEAEASVQTAAATTGPAGASTDGGLPPSDGTQRGGDAQAKAAIELDGYKNVRALQKGPDGLWRGRAMRGRTEISIRVDAAGNVSAE